MRCFGHHLRWDFLERRLSRLCCRYGYMVSMHPYPFIILPLLLTGILSVGWWFRRVSGDAVYLYTPQGAQSKFDQETIQDTFPTGNGAYVPGRMVVPNRESSVIAIAKDGGNILRIQHSQAVIRLNQFIIDHIELRVGLENYTYRELCLQSGQNCHNNPQVYIIPQMYQNPGQNTNLSYPMAVYDQRRRYYLGSTLGGVTVDPDTGQILEAKAWLMTFQLRFQNERDNRLAGLWELEFERQLLAYRDPFIDLSLAHSQTLNRELARNAKDLYPRFALMFMLLILFAVLCTVTCIWPSKFGDPKCGRRWPMIDWVLSRPNLAFLGVIGAGMGVVSAIGALSYLGTPYPDIVSVMPFLIIAVRLDNTFLMIAALDNTKRTLPVEERIAEAMSESAVSITITVLTDVLSFACGVLTDFVAVQLFCVYTTVAVLITFVYQLSFLLGFLVLYARWEDQGRHSLAPCITTVSSEDSGNRSVCVKLFCLGSRPHDKPPKKPPRQIQVLKNGHIPALNGSAKVVPLSVELPPLEKRHCAVRRPFSDYTEYAKMEHEEGSVISRWFRNVYGPFLMSKYTQVGVVVLLLLFWTTSLYGCYNLRQGLEPVKLLVDNSYAIAHFRNLEVFWDYGSQMQVIFMRPGDLTDPAHRRAILEIASDFAGQTHGIGMEGVDFWMTAFDDHLRRTEQRSLDGLGPSEFYSKLDQFLALTDNFRFRLDVVSGNRTSFHGNTNSSWGQSPITAFRFMMGIKDFRTPSEQRSACDQFRKVARKYAEFDVRVFHVMFLFVDQYEEILPNVWQEIGSGMACMIAIALFLIPHPVCSIWVTVAIASIDVGVIGYMTLWGLNMDTISMITIIMSIGFSVDFSAHIAYAYVVNIKEEPVERVCRALGTLGWPVLQGGIATLLGVVVLADLDSYMVVSFFKTVFLVIIFGLMHALIFLPVMLNGLTPTGCPAWAMKLRKAFRTRFPVPEAKSCPPSRTAKCNGHRAPLPIKGTTVEAPIRNGKCASSRHEGSTTKLANGSAITSTQCRCSCNCCDHSAGVVSHAANGNVRTESPPAVHQKGVPNGHSVPALETGPNGPKDDSGLGRKSNGRSDSITYYRASSPDCDSESHDLRRTPNVTTVSIGEETVAKPSEPQVKAGAVYVKL